MVSSKRNWSAEEDKLLSDTVLRYIQEGNTQIDAFKEVANQLNRTSAACGFRWNSTIRDNFKEEVIKAREGKSIKINNKKDVSVKQETVKDSTDNPLRGTIHFLEKLEDTGITTLSHIEELNLLKEENEILKKKLSQVEQIIGSKL